MAKTKISEFSSTPANNTDIDSINIAEGCAPSGINDAIRELMAQLKDFQTGAQGDSFNGPIGTSTAAAGAFTTLSATGAITSTLATGTAPLVIASTTKVANLNVDLLDGADWASPAALGSTTPAAVSATTLSASSTVTLSGGTTNGVAYLNGSKVLTSGSALTFDGTTLTATTQMATGTTGTAGKYLLNRASDGAAAVSLGLSSNDFSANNGAGGGYIFNISSTEQMRLTSTGLGIGTSSPTSILNLKTSNGQLLFQNGGSAAQMRISAFNNAGNANAALIFEGYSSEYGRFDSSGNLGLGVTPSAWDGALKAIQVNTQGVFASETSAVHVMTNVYYNSGYKYIGTGYATDYYQYNGLHAWRTASSGTAGNAITWTQAMTLTAAGDLGIGTTSPTTAGNRVVHIANSSGDSRLHLTDNTTGSAATDGTELAVASGDFYIDQKEAKSIILYTNGSERARIDSSGNLLVGTTDNGGTNTEGLEVYIGGGGTRLYVGHANGTANGTQYVVFNYNGTNQIGSISQSGTTAVLYNTTSDQRLKENIQDADSASSLIDALQVRKFDWKADGSHQRYGFVAQELATVYPEAVHQPQDTEQMMAVDYSKLVPLLVKEIQSLKARLDAANL